MWTLNSDLAWKKWGKKNPYYGVLSHEKYRNENLTQDSIGEFFKSGEAYVEEVFSEIHRFIDIGFFPDKVLDFGCGTGRLVIPFSKRAREVTGVDISQAMLDQAKNNCRTFNINNVKFFVSDDNLTKLKDERFDLINTYIVLQHINVSRGEKYVKSLLSKLNANGVGVIHLVFHRNASSTRKLVNYFRYRVPYLHNAVNLLQGKPFSEPLMQMNSYNINKALKMLGQHGVRELKMKLTDHSGHLGAIMIFQKP